MDSRAYSRGGVLVPSEHHITEFHSWVRAHLGEPPSTGHNVPSARTACEV
jgi:glycine betaine catabolism A